ncbi:MAG: RlmE family RNA methyltransferase [Holosporales bacterium]|nr:RlmE family RNA methyltransferase [Holosporales bacterium]
MISPKNKKKRTNSSREWILRQVSDPYVAKAKKLGYRSRAAFKLLEIDEKFMLLKGNLTVIDLGCAPGGWLQVVSQKLRRNDGNRIIGVDLRCVELIPGVTVLTGDFTEDTTVLRILEELSGQRADLILSDMAPDSCGIPSVDHDRVVGLVRNCLLFCSSALKKGGSFVTKIFHGKEEIGVLDEMKHNFAKVQHFKPAASRGKSAEIYLVAQGFLGSKS